MGTYWIGSRQWDIEDNDFFTGSVTRYGDDTNNNISFCNNKFTTNYSEFVQNCLNNILSTDAAATFMFANERHAYQYGNEVHKKSICVNPNYILESLNNKIFVRNFFRDYVTVPRSIIVNANCCTDFSFISNLFNNQYSEFVLQEASGAGGNQTYFLTNNQMPQIADKDSYILVTPYLKDTFTVNVHILVSDKSYKIMPPSVQIAINKFTYSGSDFIAFKNLPKSLKNEIFSQAQKIAKKVIDIGGRGIFGVDLLIKGDAILLLECNYRYQGSSFVLNKALTENGYPSLFELKYCSFYNNLDDIPDDIYEMAVPYSSFKRMESNLGIALPNPLLTIAVNRSTFASNEHYVKYELFDASIIYDIEKQ